jgi:hypothetical protein
VKVADIFQMCNPKKKKQGNAKVATVFLFGSANNSISELIGGEGPVVIGYACRSLINFVHKKPRREHQDFPGMSP